MAAPDPRPRLLGAWRTTLFEAEGIAIPIAPVARLRAAWRARLAAIAALLASLGVRQAAFIGAWNPCSRRHPRGCNRRRLDRLREAARRLPRHEGMGRACRPRPWGEEHLLIGAPAARCAVLARRFRQDAILVIRQRGPARMMLVRSTMLR